MNCLNPSFSGISFRTTGKRIERYKVFVVLILLLVEYPFGQGQVKVFEEKAKVLILLLVEYPFGHSFKT